MVTQGLDYDDQKPRTIAHGIAARIECTLIVASSASDPGWSGGGGGKKHEI